MDIIRVSLIVKPGPGAERVITDKLNAWFTEGTREAPYPPGALLHYFIREKEGN